MALSQKQIEQLRKMGGIDQTLLSAVERGDGNLSETEQQAVQSRDTSKERLAEVTSQDFVKPEVRESVKKSFPKLPTIKESQIDRSKVRSSEPTDPVSSMMNLQAALNHAVNVARGQRQSQELDFLGGFLPGGLEGGSVSASTFGGLLRNLNRASTQFTEPLVDDVVNFAQQEQERVESAKNSVRELGISLLDSGVSPENIQAVLAHSQTGDIDAAMVTAASVLQNTPQLKDLDIRTIKNQIVGIDPQTGEANVLFTAQGGGGSTTGGGTIGSSTGNIVGGGNSQDDTVFEDTNSGKSYNLGTTEGIRQFKADNPSVTDADIRAKLDSETSLNQSTINSLLEGSAGSSLTDQTAEAIATSLRKTFASFSENTAEELKNAKEYIKSGGKIKINGEERELNEAEKNAVIAKLDELGERTLTERILPGGG